MDQIIKYKCPKCGNSQYIISEMWASSNVIVKLLGLQNRRFTSVSCQMCHFTEFYNVPKKKIGEVINFISR